MEPWIAWVIGMAIGVVGTIVYYCIRTIFGTIKVDKSNPDVDQYRIVIDDLEQLSKKKYVRLKVDEDTDFSQE